MINSAANSGALYDAKNFIDGSTSGEVGTSVQILLLTDVAQDYYYANFGQAAGTITFDLGGHKFIQNNNIVQENLNERFNLAIKDSSLNHSFFIWE